MEFHPNFSGDGEIVLQTCDRVLFRVHALILKQSSSVFKAMLQIPQGHAYQEGEPVLLAEDSESVEFTLRCISPNATVPLLQDLSFSAVKDIACMADKYDMPRVMEFARVYTTFHWDSILRNASAVQIFGLACRWKWTDLVWKSSRETLNEKLNTTANLRLMKDALCKTELYALLQLHWTRKELLSRLSFEGQTFSIFSNGVTPKGKPRFECLCGASLAKSAAEIDAGFISLRRKVDDYLEQNPIGNELFTKTFWMSRTEKLRGITCWTCGRNVFDEDRIRQKISSEDFICSCRSLDGVQLQNIF